MKFEKLRKMRVFDFIDRQSNKQIALALFFAALLLRLAYVGFAYATNAMATFADDLGYFYLAENIVERGKMFYDTDIHLYAEMLGPGLPWLNATTMLVFGQNWMGLFLVSSLASAFITLFIYKVAVIVADRRTAILAGLWSVFYFFYISFSASAGKEAWMSLFLIVVLYLLLKLFYLKEFSWKLFALLAFVYTYSFHFDERYLIFSPFIFLYILYWEKEGFRKFQVKKALLFTLLVLILTIPWTIRNYNEFDRLVLVSVRTAPFTDKIFGYENDTYIMDNYYGEESDFFYIHEHQIDSVIQGQITVTDGGYKISEQQRQAMSRGHMPAPLTGIKAFWIRVKDMHRPFQIGGEYQRTGYFYYEKSFRHNLVSFVFYGIVFFFSFPGFYFLYKRNKHHFYLLMTAIVVFTLLHGLLIPYTHWRYRLPLDAIFIIVGALGLLSIFKTRLGYDQ